MGVILPRKQTILFFSDSHIGGTFSNFSAYQRTIIELMQNYDHVVMNGDDWELFYIAKDHVPALSTTLEIMGKDKKHWKDQFEKKKNRTRSENVIDASQWFTEAFLEHNPHVHLHVLGGNHEAVRHFRKVFEDIQKKHTNFEWSPQTIRIGDGLMTHGHLPASGKTSEEFGETRLRMAHAKGFTTRIVNQLTNWEHAYQLGKDAKAPFAHIDKILTWLKKHNGAEDFVSHNGIPEPLDMSRIRHVFFGDTHVKFNNRERDGIAFHNTGAIVRDTSQSPDGLGILEAVLEDGRITNVQPVRINKDVNLHTSRVASDQNAVINRE